MLAKQSVVVLLVGFNLLLLAALLIGSYSPSAAYAQSRGGSGEFICVTAKAQGQSYDVFYVLDVQQDKLHAFYPVSTRTREHQWAGFRDLRADFTP